MVDSKCSTLLPSCFDLQWTHFLYIFFKKPICYLGRGHYAILLTVLSAKGSNLCLRMCVLSFANICRGAVSELDTREGQRVFPCVLLSHLQHNELLACLEEKWNTIYEPCEKLILQNDIPGPARDPHYLGRSSVGAIFHSRDGRILTLLNVCLRKKRNQKSCFV